MFANLTVTTGAPRQVLTLPRTAIVYSLYGDNVFVVEPAKAAPQGAAGTASAAPAAPAASAPATPGLVVERRFVKLGAIRGERIARPGDDLGDGAFHVGGLQREAPSADREADAGQDRDGPARQDRPHDTLQSGEERTRGAWGRAGAARRGTWRRNGKSGPYGGL